MLSFLRASFSGIMHLLLNWMLPAPRILKLCSAAMHRALCISLYSTSEASIEKYQESTPSPPVRSAIRKGFPPAIMAASAALYLHVMVLLHCSAERFAGNIIPLCPYHCGILPLSFLRLSNVLIARSMSMSFNLPFPRARLVGSASRCSLMKRIVFSRISGDGK